MVSWRDLGAHFVETGRDCAIAAGAVKLGDTVTDTRYAIAGYMCDGHDGEPDAYRACVVWLDGNIVESHLADYVEEFCEPADYPMSPDPVLAVSESPLLTVLTDLFEGCPEDYIVSDLGSYPDVATAHAAVLDLVR